MLVELGTHASAAQKFARGHEVVPEDAGGAFVQWVYMRTGIVAGDHPNVLRPHVLVVKKLGAVRGYDYLPEPRGMADRIANHRGGERVHSGFGIFDKKRGEDP